MLLPAASTLSFLLSPILTLSSKVVFFSDATVWSHFQCAKSANVSTIILQGKNVVLKAQKSIEIGNRARNCVNWPEQRSRRKQVSRHNYVKPIVCVNFGHVNQTTQKSHCFNYNTKLKQLTQNNLDLKFSITSCYIPGVNNSANWLPKNFSAVHVAALSERAQLHCWLASMCARPCVLSEPRLRMPINSGVSKTFRH